MTEFAPCTIRGNPSKLTADLGSVLYIVQSCLNFISTSSAVPKGGSSKVAALQSAGVGKLVGLFETQIGHLDEATMILLKTREELTSNLIRYRNILTLPLILRLPPEILSIIFLHCLDDWTFDFGRGVWEDTPGPRHVISQVCQHWRNIVRSSPEFWRDIYITDYLNMTESECLARQRLTDDISRSKNLPLRIFDGGSRATYISKFPEILEQLAQTRNRWESFRTDSDLDNFLTLIQQAGASPKFPLLKTLQCCAARFRNYETLNQGVLSVEAPSLVNIDLDLFLYEGINPPTLPWSQLRHVSFSFPKRLSCTIKILASLTRVTELNLGIGGGNIPIYASPVPDTHATGPICFPFLNTLTLYMSDSHPSDEAMRLISLLRLPALRILSCSGLKNPALRAMIKMLDQTGYPASSNHGVHTLILENFDHRHNASSIFSSLLQCLPHLRVLSVQGLTHPEAANNLLRSLACTPELGKDVLCPALEQVSLELAVFGAPELEQFVKSRIEHEKALGSMRLKRLVLAERCKLMSGHSGNDVARLLSALQTFVRRPGAALCLDINLDTTRCILYPSGSKRVVLGSCQHPISLVTFL